MGIIYKQPQYDSILKNIGIKNCYFKQLFFENDMKNVTKKEHHHTGFEIHIVESGYQVYKINGKIYKIEDGHFLAIPPALKHCTVDYAPNTSKISVIFNVESESFFADIKSFVYGETDIRISDNIKYILEENKKRRFFSMQITEGRSFEIIVLIFRLCGFKEIPDAGIDASEDIRISMAKQYIKDNIEFDLNVSDVASYCYLGTKQFTRLFKKSDNVTPAVYIQKQKIEYIEKLLCETELSLCAISEKMNFSSEYHFNSFFKKYAGIPPGEYRKMMK